MVEFVISAVNISTETLYLGLACNPQWVTTGTASNMSQTWSEWMRILKTYKYTVIKTLTGAGGSRDKATLKLKVPIGKMLGSNSYRRDEDFVGGAVSNAATSPAKVATATLVLMNINGGAVAADRTVALQIYANIYCTFQSKDYDVI